MAVTRSAAKTAAARSAAKPVRDGVTLQMFLWEGTDKRGTKMKGEQQAKSSNMLLAELRRQGIQPRMVKPKPKPLLGTAGKALTPKDIAVFRRTSTSSDRKLAVSVKRVAGRADLGGVGTLK